jgi:hypothetical protein
VCRYQFALAGVGLSLGCLVLMGCSSGTTPVVKPAPASYTHLRIIGDAYLQATKALERPPQSVEDLMPFLKKHGDPAEILRSPDDGENYKILWGVDILNLQTEGGRYPVLAYEQQGKDGKRYVLEVRFIHQMSDEQFQKAVFPPGYKAPG